MVDIMTKTILNLRKPATIVACLAIIALFYGCNDNRHSHADYLVLVEYDLMIMTRDMGIYTWSDARKVCEQVRLGGFSDWRLPTQTELEILYIERHRIGGFDVFNNIRYWSSTPAGIGGGFYMCQNFTNGTVGHHLDMLNQQPLAARCIRSIHP